MSAGSIIPRRPRPELPDFKLGALSPLKSVEPLLQYMRATAERTLEIEEAEIEEMKAIRKLLEELVGLARRN